jgi:hypothetical protein
LKRRRSGIPEHIPSVVSAGTRFGVPHNGQSVLGAEDIVAAAQGESRTDEVAEFLLEVQGCGVPRYVIMNVPAVGMGVDQKGMTTFGKTHGELVSDAVRFLFCYLAGLE